MMLENLLEKIKAKWKQALMFSGLLFLLLIVGAYVYQLFSERTSPKKVKVARVFDKYLYNIDMKGLTNPFMSKEDSTKLANYHIENWIRRNLMVSEAESAIPPNSDKIKQQLQDYQESLLLFLYEKELLKKNLDTLVKEEEIERYYNKYKESFELRDYALKAKFVVVRKETPQQHLVQSWMNTAKYEEKLQEYCYQYAVNFSLTPTWYTLDNFNDKIPLQPENPAKFLKNNRFYKTSDDTNTYFVAIESYGLRGNIAPLDYKKQDITKIIVNKRKLEQVKNIEDKIYQKALRKRHFEIY